MMEGYYFPLPVSRHGRVDGNGISIMALHTLLISLSKGQRIFGI
jgi:hypothetical protein